ncbi:MAG: oligosaccharide flippase family protein [Candidatus Cohnella colombiensis]|uniref:Oligosaccharide flippase family protein n=1 Tax=Candidatus Cohnella colombiensis TaxID=3121368 RepID=A0AA95JEU6_9BACL|nr:MAG: oligosaccharide flippase family protein [Cohnella sp.]
MQVQKTDSKYFSLKRNISWTLIGNIIYAITQWALIIVIARWSNPELVGQFSLALAYVSPLILLSQLQLRALQVVDTRGKYTFGNYAGIRIVITVVAVVVIPCILFIVGEREELVWLSIVIAIAKGFESISDIIHGALQKREQFQIISISKIGKGLLAIGAFAMGMYIWRDALPDTRLLAATACMAVAWAIQLVVYDIRKIRRYEAFRPDYRWGPMLELAVWGAPLGIVVMLSSLSTQIPRILISRELGSHDLGIFSALGYLLTAGMIVSNAIGQAAAPRMSRLCHQRKLSELHRLVIRLSAVGGVIGAIGILIAVSVGKELLELIYNADYAVHSLLLVVLLVSGMIDFIATFFGYALTAMHAIKIQPYIAALWTICAIVATWLMLPHFGIIGAAYALIVSTGCRLILQVAVFYWRIRKSLLYHNDTD